MDELITDSMPNFFDETMRMFYEKVMKQKEEFIKDKFIEKGFKELVENLATKRFPGIAIIKYENWEYYYADNGTDNGKFIVAIQDFDYKTEEGDNNGIKMNMSFNWQDKVPLPHHLQINQQWKTK